MSGALPPFQKPALSPEGHVELLRSRGLLIEDVPVAVSALRTLGYYRLSAYMLPFQRGDHGADHHQFRPGTTLAEVLGLYDFDRTLRRIVCGVLEDIEVALRAALTDTLSLLHGPHWFVDASHYSSKTAEHEERLNSLREGIGTAQQPRTVAVGHFFATYSSPEFPPCWMTLEALPFGTLSTLFMKLRPDRRKLVAARFGQDDSIAASWMHAASTTRNLCAHHQRIWNRIFNFKPKIAKALEQDLTPNTHFYAQAVVFQSLGQISLQPAVFARELKAHLAEATPERLGAMGFPSDWASRPIWNAP